MRSLIPIVLLATSLPTQAARAQEVPGPAPQLAKLDKMIGHFKGSGTFVAQPGMSPQPWTSTSTAKRILGGHFIQEDTAIDVGAPEPLQFRAIFGYDRELEKLVMFSVGNNGLGHFSEVDWLDGKMVVMGRAIEFGQPTIQRSVRTLTDAGSTYEAERAMGLGEFHTTLEGTLERVAKPEPAVAEAGFSAAPPPPQLAKLDRVIGEWKITGSMIPAPGAPAMEISGGESVRAAFGGRVIESRVVGDPGPNGEVYESVSFMTWNPASSCFDTYAADNMGVIGKSEGRFVGNDRFVATTSRVVGGLPQLERITIVFDEKGMTGVEMDAISGADAPHRVFTGEYSRTR